MRAAFGSWKSPITTELITAGSTKLSEVVGFDGRAFWVEGRPSEKGRCVVVEHAGGGGGGGSDGGPVIDRVGADANARTRAHEYGGGSFALHPDAELLLYTDFASQDLYCKPLADDAAAPPTLVAGGGADATFRYADMAVDAARNAVVCVREDHSARGAAGGECPAAAVVNTIVSLALPAAQGFDAGGAAAAAAATTAAAAAAASTSASVLASGRDFYMSPRLSPDGAQLAFITWDHPSMPWDDTELWLQPLATPGCPVGGEAAAAAAVRVAGGGAESVMQPRFAPDGSALFFISDRSDFWNLYRYDLASGAVEAVLPLEAEVGGPAWRFGDSAYDFVLSSGGGEEAGSGGGGDGGGSAGTLALAVRVGDRSRIVLCDLGNGTAAQASLPFTLPPPPGAGDAGVAVAGSRAVVMGGDGLGALPTSIGQLSAAGPRTLLLLGGGPSSAPSVVRVDLGAGARAEEAASGARAVVLRKAFDPAAVSPGASAPAALEPYISTPELVEFPTTLADGTATTAWAHYYAPKNADYAGGMGGGGGAADGDGAERPPLLVKIHGGPTSSASTALRLDIQFWTSRGVAVADVDYGGSSGYGRRYRERLRGAWGIVDRDDACAAAEFLASVDARGGAAVDAARLAIDGVSAGGFTTLAALCFRDTFSAGTSLYGVADLTALAADTHKFESRYLDRLVAPYPEGAALYAERSPTEHAGGLDCPLLLLQGDEDKVVPPNQARMMHAAVKEKGVPVALLMFEGEQHGFRQSHNIRRALEAELLFYGRIFGFEPADAIEPFHIDNM